MSRIKDPEGKKKASLERDHRTFVLEGNKSFRTAWPLKKALTNRRFRKAGATALAEAVRDENGNAREQLIAKPKRTLKKIGVRSLAQALVIKGDKAGARWRRLEKNLRAADVRDQSDKS